MIPLAIDWNVNDTLVNLGPIPIKYYSLMFVVAFVVGLRLMKNIFIHEKVDLEKLDTLFIYSVVSILIDFKFTFGIFFCLLQDKVILSKYVLHSK